MNEHRPAEEPDQIDFVGELHKKKKKSSGTSIMCMHCLKLDKQQLLIVQHGLYISTKVKIYNSYKCFQI